MLFNIEITETNCAEHDADELVDGLTKLGNGCFATAYASGRDQVIKVSVGNDWGYMSFLEAMSRMKSHNPWLPRIHWVRVFMGRSGRDSDSRIVTCLERLERPWDSSGDVEDLSQKNAPLWQVYATMCKEIEGHVDRPETRQQDWIKRNPQLREALAVIHVAMASSGRGTDLHCGNFMVRGRQLVITDPIGF